MNKDIDDKLSGIEIDKETDNDEEDDDDNNDDEEESHRPFAGLIPDKSNKSGRVIIAVVIILLLVIGVINLTKNLRNDNDDSSQYTTSVFECMSENSALYIATNCPHCASQQLILGDYLELFNVIDCRKDAELCSGIKKVPTWIINGKSYTGIIGIPALKEATGC